MCMRINEKLYVVGVNSRVNYRQNQLVYKHVDLPIHKPCTRWPWCHEVYVNSNVFNVIVWVKGH